MVNKKNQDQTMTPDYGIIPKQLPGTFDSDNTIEGKALLARKIARA